MVWITTAIVKKKNRCPLFFIFFLFFFYLHVTTSYGYEIPRTGIWIKIWLVKCHILTFSTCRYAVFFLDVALLLLCTAVTKCDYIYKGFRWYDYCNKPICKIWKQHVKTCHFELFSTWLTHFIQSMNLNCTFKKFNINTTTIFIIDIVAGRYY